MIAYRTMIPADISAGLNLCRLAGWNQIARDWELFLDLHPDGSVVAVDELGKVIGTVSTLRYQNHFSWIGMVLVQPSRRHEGIGTRLLKQALILTENDETVKLDATPAGREVYLKLGFVEEYEIIRTVRKGPQFDGASVIARPLTKTDFSQLLKMDGEVFGADRRVILESNFKGSGQYAFIAQVDGRVKGYCLGRPGYEFDHIGPVVADDVNIAAQLLYSALGEAQGRPVVMDIMTHTQDWTNFVLSLGFAHLRPLTRMYRGSNRYPGIPKKQFAILGPEFG